MAESNPVRRRNPEKTRANILAAAQKAFSEVGYAHAGIRHIAGIAGVDSALIQRYFGSKAGLFEAALSAAIPPIGKDGVPFPELGARLTGDSLAGVFDLRAQSMIVLSISHAEARTICVRTLKARAIDPLAELLGPPDPEARAIRLVMLMTGFMLFTRQVQLMTPQEAQANGSSDWLSGLMEDIGASA